MSFVSIHHSYHVVLAASIVRHAEFDFGNVTKWHIGNPTDIAARISICQ